MGRTPKIDKRQLLGMLADNFTDSQIARKLGVSRQAINKKKRQWQLKAEAESKNESIFWFVDQLTNAIHGRVWLEIIKYSNLVREFQVTHEVILDYLEKEFDPHAREKIMAGLRERLGREPLLVHLRRPTETWDPGEPGSMGNERIPE